MFFLTYGEKGPRVVLAQALLRLKGIDVRINGVWDEEFLKGVRQYRSRLNLHPTGPIDGKVFISLIQETRLKVVDSIDASGGEASDLDRIALKQTGASEPLMNERVSGQGVAKATGKIIERAKYHRIALLRIYGHGNRGTWICVALGDPVHAQIEGRDKDYAAMKADWKSYIDYSHFERHRETLAQISPLFAAFASVELHACKIGKQKKLLQKMADMWGVPVTGGMGNQNGYDYSRNQWGEWVPHAFTFEGETFTAYPNNGNLYSWATSVEAALPNIIRLINQMKQRVSGILNG